MNDSFDFERYVVDRFAEVTPSRPPASSLDRILIEASRTRPLPRWLADIKEPPMRAHTHLVVGSPTRRLTAGLALAAALVLALAGVVVAGSSLLPSPDAVIHVRNGLIAFDSNGDIFVTDVADTDRHQLSTGPTWDYSPTWSPQGDRIAYWTMRTPGLPPVLMVMNADGSNQSPLRDLVSERLGSDGAPPVWSPDGRRILYDVSDGSTNWIEVVDLASGQYRRLATGLAPAWSPDGTAIVHQGGNDQTEVWTMAADGTNPKRLTTGTGAVWSVKDQIAYMLDQADGQGHDIWVMNADGSNPVNVTNTATDEYWPSWSPNGTRVAFDRPANGAQEITVAAADGAGPVTLQGDPVGGGPPVWSPDGSMVMFGNFRAPDGGYAVTVWDASGAPSGVFIPADGLMGVPSWQAVR